MIFLDLTKAYNALDRSRCLEILVGYGVGPSARRLLTTYWRRLTIVARAGGYYGKSFKGERGVTQGYPLSPTIFNVVVDAVVRHWVNGLVDKTEEKGKRGGRDVTSRRFSTQTTAWSSRRTPPGSRVRSTPWWPSLTGWSCLTTSVRRSAWYATPVGRGPETGLRKYTVGG